MAGKQPDWKFTPLRKASIRKARRIKSIYIQLGKEEYLKRYGKRKK